MVKVKKKKGVPGKPLCLRDKIIRRYGYGTVVTPEMLHRWYGSKYSKSYLDVILAKGEKSRRAWSFKTFWVFTWRVGEGRYKIIRPYRKGLAKDW